jgi:hypothetical protein
MGSNQLDIFTFKRPKQDPWNKLISPIIKQRTKPLQKK